jgi:hypothetical protein
LRKFEKIEVSKGEEDVRFDLSGLYGPEKLETTLTKRSDY